MINPFGFISKLFKKDITVQKLEQWLQVIQTIAPLVISLVSPSLAPIAGSITDGIQQAEAMGAAGTLTDKLSHVQKIATDAATVTNAASGKQLIDPSLLINAVNSVVSVVVSTANLVAEAKK